MVRTPLLLLVLLIIVLMIMFPSSLVKFLLREDQRGTVLVQPYGALLIHHRGLDVGEQGHSLRQWQQMLRGGRLRGKIDHEVLGGVIKDIGPGSTNAILAGRGTAEGTSLGSVLIVTLVLEVLGVLLVAAVANLVLHQQFQRWQFGVMVVWTPILVYIRRI